MPITIFSFIAVLNLNTLVFIFFTSSFHMTHSVSLSKVINADNVTEIKSVGKREVESEEDEDFYPNWVPFKNKHGDELGKFQEVRKAKPKKRLALPMSFRLKRVADGDGEDYYEKGQGEGVDEDYYEKKEWSDFPRDVNPTTTSVKPNLNHTDISEIDGVVKLLIKDSQNIKPLKKEEEDEGKRKKKKRIGESNTEKRRWRKKLNDDNDYLDEQEKKKAEIINNDGIPSIFNKEDEDSAEIINKDSPKTQKEQNERDRDNEDEMFREEIESELHLAKSRYGKGHKSQEKKTFTQPEDKKNIEITDGDDEKDDGKYESQRDTTVYREAPTTTTPKPKRIYSSNQRTDKKQKQSVFDNPGLYMVNNDEEEKEEENEEDSSNEITTTEKPKTAAEIAEEEENRRRIFAEVDKLKAKHEAEIIRQRNRDRTRELYYEATRDPDTERKTTSSDYVRVSLVPLKEDKDGEPTLFFPIKNKPSRSRGNNKTPKPRTTTPKPPEITTAFREPTRLITAPSSPDYPPQDVVPLASHSTSAFDVDSLIDDTGPSSPQASSVISGPEPTSTGAVSSAEPSRTDVEPTSPETGPSSPDSGPSGADTEPSSPDVQPSASGTRSYIGSTAPDVESSADSSFVPSHSTSAVTAVADSDERTDDDVIRRTEDDAEPASSEHKKKEHGGDHKHEEGEGKEFHSEAEAEHGESGKKSYKGHHEDSKSAVGKHEKEDHLGKYEDKGGHDNRHHDESGHYGKHHHEEEGKKHAEYEESGKHSKGHSTKGSHDIHKKEEYEKNVTFFEEEGDSAEEEKHGGYKKEKSHGGGGNYKHGKHLVAHNARQKGENGKYLKGGHRHAQTGHKASGGRDGHHKHEVAQGHLEAAGEGQKWMFHHGHPAKTANLVIIDRRADQLQRGPVHFGRQW
ncbi:hypothetical protein JYU34_010232 [Plutella xylostella]|uniref:Uncharacterized protein n=1 Tax=Plutella xylostella TaxID=51655 RepID=A0ABQ7QI03_PLUXY|nr:hypothetical protein JYU34_010232 [Plutella xylostella]